MDNIVSIADKNQAAYLKGKKASDAEALKQKEFGYEMRSDGLTTGIGRRRKHSSAPAKSYLGAISTSFKALVTAIMASDVIQTNLENLRALIKSAGDVFAASATTPVVAAEQTLSQAFEGSVGVNAEVYEALQAEVADFNAIQNAKDADFIGPMPNPEMQAYREGLVCGPLTCEFHAHASLKTKNIEYVPEHQTYIFPEEMVNALTDKFGSVAQADAKELVTVAFKDATTSLDPQIVHKLEPILKPKPAPVLEPAPVFVAK